MMCRCKTLLYCSRSSLIWPTMWVAQWLWVFVVKNHAVAFLPQVAHDVNSHSIETTPFIFLDWGQGQLPPVGQAIRACLKDWLEITNISPSRNYTPGRTGKGAGEAEVVTCFEWAIAKMHESSFKKKQNAQVLMRPSALGKVVHGKDLFRMRI
jgi:hypothetical protein